MQGAEGDRDAVRRSPTVPQDKQLQELTQLSRTQVYALVGRYRETDGGEGMPVTEFGRNLRVPKAALMRMALVDPDAEIGDDHAA